MIALFWDVNMRKLDVSSKRNFLFPFIPTAFLDARSFEQLLLQPWSAHVRIVWFRRHYICFDGEGMLQARGKREAEE